MTSSKKPTKQASKTWKAEDYSGLTHLRLASREEWLKLTGGHEQDLIISPHPSAPSKGSRKG